MTNHGVRNKIITIVNIAAWTAVVIILLSLIQPNITSLTMKITREHCPPSVAKTKLISLALLTFYTESNSWPTNLHELYSRQPIQGIKEDELEQYYYIYHRTMSDVPSATPVVVLPVITRGEPEGLAIGFQDGHADYFQGNSYTNIPGIARYSNILRKANGRRE